MSKHAPLESTMPGPSSAIIDHLLGELWERGGSDLLLTSGSAPFLRVDGALRPVDGPALTEPEVDRLVTGVLGGELTERFRQEKQVDFAFSWGTKARMRGNAFTQRGASALALRIIPYEVPSSEQLGLPPAVIGWAGLPRGFVLVTGPTGSGKSTSLAALLDYVNTHRPVHILTIEDPIEYLHRHKRAAVNQREVGTDTDSFPAALRSALREDPDVLLLGEMRDPESISAALTIAETGHLVFATLHTNDTSQTLDRIVDVFPAEQQPQVRLQLAHTLVGILNQTLIPRTGGGRVAAFEVLTGTSAIRNLIREGKTRQIRNMISTGHREGMQTLEASINAHLAAGTIAYEEAVLHTAHPEDIQRPHALAARA
ncbi:type IV pilus twitching motility protein PilT [Streptomyces sp. NBC_00083]|uniref:type IV pilus twitching motility protein PilT n=1 Tax=Streptomyces sp. NBC_00083 TaxID=2975647 RepID=UPI0022567154|nr:type IV pilus twitching motility protein PilT [Streptomyces sp. NBC_00083]MCX5384162.1 type IV pilus twitching motility protein PilT [Streptomyces sp. NBC_00083]